MMIRIAFAALLTAALSVLGLNAPRAQFFNPPMIFSGATALPVQFDADFTTPANNSGVTVLASNALTIGNHPNLVLVAALNMTPVSATGIACNWDFLGTPQLMTALTGTDGNDPTNTIRSILFGLVNPTQGNLQLRCTWTGSVTATMNGASFYNATQFKNGAHNSANANPATVSLTNVAGGIAVDTYADVTLAVGTAGGSQTVLARTNSGTGMGSSYITSTGSVTFTWTMGGSDNYSNSAASVSP